MTTMPWLVVLVVGQLVLVLLVQSRSMMPLSYVMLGHRKVDRVTKRIGWMLLYRTDALSLSRSISSRSKPPTTIVEVSKRVLSQALLSLLFVVIGNHTRTRVRTRSNSYLAGLFWKVARSTTHACSAKKGLFHSRRAALPMSSWRESAANGLVRTTASELEAEWWC